MSADNDNFRIVHESLADSYLFAMDCSELRDLARCIGINPDALERRALNARFERYQAMTNMQAESTKQSPYTGDSIR